MAIGVSQKFKDMVNEALEMSKIEMRLYHTLRPRHYNQSHVLVGEDFAIGIVGDKLFFDTGEVMECTRTGEWECPFCEAQTQTPISHMRQHVLDGQQLRLWPKL